MCQSQDQSNNGKIINIPQCLFVPKGEGNNKRFIDLLNHMKWGLMYHYTIDYIQYNICSTWFLDFRIFILFTRVIYSYF